MKIRTTLLLTLTHITAIFLGVSIGIYTLPILIAPPAPSDAEIKAISSQASFTAQFSKERKDSDTLHWGEGTVSVGSKFITLIGELAPGPDYKLYLSSQFLETEADFNRLKNTMVRVGDVKTFENFAVKVPESIDPSRYNSVVIWCEAFGQFITSAKYR